jgi:hypothetical protein
MNPSFILCRVESYVTTDGQLASLSWNKASIWGLRPDFYYCQTVAGLLMWSALSDERTGLPVTIAAGPRQCSHSWVRVPRDSWPYITVSDSRFPQPGGPGLRIYIPQEQGGPVISPGTGFPFRRLLRLAGLGGGIQTRLQAGVNNNWTTAPRYISPARTVQKTSHYFVFSRFRGNGVSTELFPSNGYFTVACLHRCYLEMCLHVTI